MFSRSAFTANGHAEHGPIIEYRQLASKRTNQKHHSSNSASNPCHRWTIILNRPQLGRHSACGTCCSCKRASEFARAAALGCSALSCARCPPATSHRAATHRAMSGPSASLTDHRLATTSSGRLAAQGHGTREYCTAVSHSRPSTTIGRPTSVGTQSLRTSSSSGFGLNLACSKSRNSISAVHSSHTPSCAS